MKVLLADSDPLFRRLVASRLEKMDYTVTTVPTGAEAWALYEESEYRVVITEYDLPGLDGTELCRRIRELGSSRHTYVMFYSVRNDSSSIVEAFQAGADDFLSKPFNPTLLDLRLARAKRELSREDDLWAQANHDSLTGFIKYDTFLRFFTVYHSGAKRYKYRGIVTFVTIDNYAEIRDGNGQGVANQAKSLTASIIGSCIRDSDLVAHVGEESGEYCILMPDTPMEGIEKVVARVESRIKTVAIHHGSGTLRPILSYGTAVYPNGELSAAECLAPENREPLVLAEGP